MRCKAVLPLSEGAVIAEVLKDPVIEDAVEERKPAPENFHGRPLPASCVDFSSSLGKKLFREALSEGSAEIYFVLSPQFLTQDEPAYCGLSSLAMVLNSFWIDPGSVWKNPWRFYHESMFSCCISLELVKKTGINLQQFTSLASYNGLDTKCTYADSSNNLLDDFRQELEESVRSEDTVIVASYDRGTLSQTGTGHFSPIAAYNRQSDSVLIMDVARFKYPPHWVSLPLLVKAMMPIDTTTSRSRGFVRLRRSSPAQTIPSEENVPPQ